MMRDGIRRYMVESRNDYTEIFDNYMNDYVYAETEMKQSACINNGC